MNNHTPGPWLQEEVTSTERHVFDSLGEDGLLGPIAIIQHGDPAELEANALLIAAAPELLSVLKDALKIVDAYRRIALGDGDITAMNARAVIAKATGSAA